MKELLQEEFPEFLRGFEEERHGGVRFNSLKVTKNEWERIAPFAIQQVPWIHNGYFYSLTDQPAKHPYYYAGLMISTIPLIIVYACCSDIIFKNFSVGGLKG